MLLTSINKEKLKLWCTQLTPNDIKLVYGENFIEFISEHEYTSKDSIIRRIRSVMGEDITIPRFEFQSLGRKTLRAIAIRLIKVLKVEDDDMLYADFATEVRFEDLNPDTEYHLYRLITYERDAI